MPSIKTLLKLTVFLAVLSIISSGLIEEKNVNFVTEWRNCTGAENGPNMKYKDMPNIKDLNSYLNSIQRIINFSNNNKNDLDINYSFGLFLMNVVKMISNDTAWAMRTSSFTRPTPIDPKWRKEERFKVWDDYKESVRCSKTLPGPKESDQCISSLSATNDASATEETPTTPLLCKIHSRCYNIIRNGGDTGYSMTHRFLFMLMARYGRYCTVFSIKQDKEVSARLCSSMYAEAEYIAAHGFQFFDLFAEQVAICSVDGHIEFLQRSWLAKILEHQQDEGCFGVSTDVEDVFNSQNKQIKTRKREWRLSKNMDQQDLLDGKCNGHVTATAAGAIAAGVRLIITLSDFLVVE